MRVGHNELFVGAAERSAEPLWYRVPVAQDYTRQAPLNLTNLDAALYSLKFADGLSRLAERYVHHGDQLMSYVLRVTRLFVAFAFLGAMSTPLFAGGASAQTVPSPFACSDVEPLSLLDLFNLVDDLEEMSDANAYLTTSVWGPSLQEGEDVTAVDQTAIQETMDAFIACVNERDPMRLLSLLSERYQALMVLDLLGGADAMEVIAEQIPTIVESDEAAEPVATPEIVRAWRPTGNPTDVWAVVSATVPGFATPVEFFVAFTPGGDNWVIDYIAQYQSE